MHSKRVLSAQNLFINAEVMVKLSLYTQWKQSTGVDLHSCLTSALDDGEWHASHPGCLAPRGTLPVPMELDAGWATRAGLNVLN